jgi:hypothetical protein
MLSIVSGISGFKKIAPAEVLMPKLFFVALVINADYTLTV